MVKKPEDYNRSSYSMYIDTKKEEFICSNTILSYFKGKDKELYRKYVETAMKEL